MSSTARFALRRCVSRWRRARSTRFSSLITCTGSRIVRDWFMIARSMFWRIHQVA